MLRCMLEGLPNSPTNRRRTKGLSMLTIQNLTHVYRGGTKALDNVSLEIDRGMFGLLGPNGAGKSTFMRDVATLQTPAAVPFASMTSMSSWSGKVASRAGIPAAGFWCLPPRIGLRHARPHGGAERNRKRPRAPRNSGVSPQPDKSLGAPYEESYRRLLRRHAAALRHCPGAHRASLRS